MMKQKAISIVILIFILITGGCASSGRDALKESIPKETAFEKGCDNSDVPGYGTIERDGDQREYILHLPSSYDGKTAVPLLLNFHGFGGCAGEFSRNIGENKNLHSLSDSENFIVLYPQAVMREKEGAYWDPGDNGSHSILDNDIFFVEQLILEIAADYNVDLSRVYASGYSNGGMMAYGLACERGDLIAAAGVMSGTMLEGKCQTGEHTSLIIFHGIDDGVLPYEGNEYYSSVSDVVQFWLNHNAIPDIDPQSTKLNGGDVLKEVYQGGREDTSVVLYTIIREFNKPGGHVWFSNEIDGVEPNQILWDFLSSHRTP